MERHYRIEVLPKRSATVILPDDLQGHVGLSGEISLAFGAGQAAARLTAGGGPSLLISGDLVRRLRLPTGLTYRIRAGLSTIRIGPVIGILAGQTPDELTADRLRAVASHLLDQPRRGGLFFSFALESADAAQGLVEGHCIRPEGKRVWEPGIFPLPQVIFCRYGLRLGAALGSLKAKGVKVFNERLFHKGEAWKWMAADRRLLPHLPETAPQAGVPSVLALLSRHLSVYVKPVWGSLAKGVLRVTRSGSGFSLALRDEDRVICSGEADLAKALAPRLPRPGIIQQGLNLASAGGRLVDFRVVLQKDGAGRWKVPGIVGRCGTAGLHVSNMAAGGFPVPLETGLALLFGDHPAALFLRKQELTELAVAVGEAVDKSGLLIGDLGLDIAYDHRGHPWVIEANNRDPDHSIGWEAGDWPLYYRYRTMPIDYACFLSGYGRACGHGRI